MKSYTQFLEEKHKEIQYHIENKIDRRQTDNGYFNLEGYIEQCELDWTQDVFAIIMNGPRNIGKSYGIWKWIEDNIWIPSNYTKTIAYMRTNLTKLKKVRDTFNAAYQDKYYMSENAIYKIELDEDGNKTNKKNWRLIGNVMGVANAENYRSAWFQNCAGIFWDEYNEETARGLWANWINLWKTVKRMNAPFFTLLAGNKNDPDNDILVHLEVDLQANDDGEDLFLKLAPRNTFFIDISMGTFNQLSENYDSIINDWAKCEEATNRFLNEGGYLTQRAHDIMLYKHIISDENFKVERNITYNEFVFEMGSFGDNNTYFKQIDIENPNYPTLAFDNMGYIAHRRAERLLDDDFYVEFVRMLKYKSKNHKLFFTTYDAKEILLKYIVLNSELIDD